MSADVVNHLNDCSRDYFKCHEAARKDPVKLAAFWQPRMNVEHVTPLSAILTAMYDYGKKILEFGKESAESHNVQYFLNSTLVPKIKKLYPRTDASHEITSVVDQSCSRGRDEVQ